MHTSMNMDVARERLALPLDVASLREARELIRQLRDYVGVFKVGLELFSAVGPDAIKLVHDEGRKCFVDLKLHDIPNTMTRAALAVAEHKAAFLTVHACSGQAALEMVSKALTGSPTRLLAVTALTSLSSEDLTTLGVSKEVGSYVQDLAELSQSCGISGIVSSAVETEALKRRFPTMFFVTPGIRLPGGDVADQKRVATPELALRSGADLLVVGRAIVNAINRSDAAQQVLDAIAKTLSVS